MGEIMKRDLALSIFFFSIAAFCVSAQGLTFSIRGLPTNPSTSIVPTNTDSIDTYEQQNLSREIAATSDDSYKTLMKPLSYISPGWGELAGVGGIVGALAIAVILVYLITELRGY